MLYKTDTMDKKLGFKGNFSGYVNGHKRPSAEKINKFYQLFGKDLERYERVIPETDDVSAFDHVGHGSELSSEIKGIKASLDEIKELLASDAVTQALALVRQRLDSIEQILSDKKLHK